MSRKYVDECPGRRREIAGDDSCVLQSSASGPLYLVDDGVWRDKLVLPMRNDLDGVAVFVAVAETKGFRAAGERLGVRAKRDGFVRNAAVILENTSGG